MKSRTSLSILGVLLVSLVAAPIVNAEEAHDVFLQINDELTGQHNMSSMAGVDVSQMVKVLSFSDGLEQSTTKDPRGRIASRAQLSEVVITKPVDQSTPLFYKALNRNETIPSALFHFFGPYADSGQTFEFYQVQLLNARVTSVATKFVQGIGLVQEVKLLAQTMLWSYFGAGGSSEYECANAAIY